MDLSPLNKKRIHEPTSDSEKRRAETLPANKCGKNNKLENHHFSSINIIKGSGKNQQRILKSLGQSLLRNSINSA